MNPALTDQRPRPLFPSFATDESCLTPREVEILEWVFLGKTNNEIGLILGISHRTVAKHLEHIYCKFGVKSRTDVVVHLFRMIQQKLPVQP